METAMGKKTRLCQRLTIQSLALFLSLAVPTSLQADNGNLTGTENAASCGGPTTCFYDQEGHLNHWVTECDLDYYNDGVGISTKNSS